MGRGDDEIKVVAFGIEGKLFAQVGLDAKLHAEKEPYFACIFFLVFSQVIKIGIRIQLKHALIFRFFINKIHVQMFCKAHGGKPQFNAF